MRAFNMKILALGFHKKVGVQFAGGVRYETKLLKILIESVNKPEVSIDVVS